MISKKGKNRPCKLKGTKWNHSNNNLWQAAVTKKAWLQTIRRGLAKFAEQIVKD